MPESFNTKDEIKVFLAQELSKSSEVTVEEEIKKITPIVEDTQTVVEDKTSIPKFIATENKIEEQKKAVVGKTVKIEQESIDSLVNIVGELLH